MEFKGVTGRHNSGNDIRINRNIMECKGQEYDFPWQVTHCINRNIMECKGGFVIIYLVFLFVLIETSWNVKSFYLHRLFLSVCINRNIMECKVP